MWDTEEQMETLRGLVDERISKSEETELRHPRSLDQQEPDAEALGRELEKIESLLEQPEHQEEDRIRSRSRLRTICSQVEWVRSNISREALTQRVNQLWEMLKSEESV
jgi:Rad3-related DNA helicase